MKKLLVLLTLLCFSMGAFSADKVSAVEIKPPKKTKQVCKVVKGKKQCKTIKIHKKIANATKVPEPVKKPKKKK